ncbi:MAG: sigma-70 family RNA polymerase sigma factor [Ruminiclostridium sp.]|nr:sigma-70 family RNA polymerase sigma factor [Ruminiclostridium sp.]
MKVSDEELAAAIKQQPDPMHSSEMALLISRYSSVIRIKAAKLCTSDIEPEDLCQEGYLALFDALRAFDNSKGSFSSFAGTCIANRMKNAVAKAHGKLTKDDDFDLGQVADESSSADDYVITKEDNEVVEHLLSFLSQKEYSAMKLFLEGYSYKQIAERLGITPKSADNALSRARKKLKQLL